MSDVLENWRMHDCPPPPVPPHTCAFLRQPAVMDRLVCRPVALRHSVSTVLPFARLLSYAYLLQRFKSYGFIFDNYRALTIGRRSCIVCFLLGRYSWAWFQRCHRGRTSKWGGGTKPTCVGHSIRYGCRAEHKGRAKERLWRGYYLLPETMGKVIGASRWETWS